MVIIQDILYLSFADLIQYGYTETYLWKVASEYRNGTATAYANIPDPADARKKLIRYNSIPVKAVADRGIPTEEQLKSSLITHTIGQDVQQWNGLHGDKALDFFKSNAHTYPYAQELAEQAQWLLWFAGLKPSKAKQLGYGSVDELYQDAIKQLNEKDWKRWKVNSLQVLSRKIKPFKALFKKPLSGNYTDVQFKQALESLVHKGFGNSNREKLGQEQEACIFTLYANGEAKLTETQVYAFYLNIASRKIAAGEWNENAIVSLSTIKNFLYRDDIKQAYWKSRHGKQEYRRTYETITHRRPASFANALWVIDGTPVHRYYMNNGRAYSRLDVFVVLDAHSWCVLGFYIGENENTTAVITSLRAGCELSNYIPHQIQFDNSSAIKSYHAQTCMRAIAKYLTPTIVGNARAKVVEPFFKHFNSQVLRFRPGYTHSPVMSNNLNGKPNPEALQQAVKGELIPTSVNQAIKELHEDFALWNHKPFNGPKSPLEKYRSSIAATQHLQRAYTPQVMIEAFYTMPGKLKQQRGVDEEGRLTQFQQFIPQEYIYSNDGLEITIDKTKHTFITDDADFNVNNRGRKFYVKYDPLELERDGLKHIYLYEPHETGARPLIFKGYQARLNNPHLFAQALTDRVEGEGAKLHTHLQAKKDQEAQIDGIAERYRRLAKATGTFVEIKAENAYPKDVLNAAKQERMEQIISGDQYRLTETNATDTEENNQSDPADESLKVKVGPSLSRWDSD